MKRYLNLLLVLLLVGISTTSCRDDDYDFEEKTVDSYKAIQKKKGGARYLYDEPSVNSSHAATITGTGEIGVLYDQQIVNGELWYLLGEEEPDGYKWDEPRKGWILASQVEKCGSGTIKIEVKSRARMMELADQPIAHFILDTKEKIREKWALDDKALLIATVYSVLIWALFFIIRATHSVRLWHLLVLFIVSAMQYVILFTCDIYDLRGNFDNFLLDLIVGLLWLAAPLAQVWVMKSVLTPILMGDFALCSDEDDDVEDVYVIPQFHFIVTLLSIVVMLGCYHFNKDWVDGAIIFCAAVQVLAFIVMWITSQSFFRSLIYMPLFIIIALPTVYISLSSFVMLLGIIAVMTLLFSPIGGGKVAEVVGHKIFNAFGQEVDEVDSSGHSSKTGDNYDLNADGTAEKR